jgi:hypothetical protein
LKGANIGDNAQKLIMDFMILEIDVINKSVEKNIFCIILTNMVILIFIVFDFTILKLSIAI